MTVKELAQELADQIAAGNGECDAVISNYQGCYTLECDHNIQDVMFDVTHCVATDRDIPTVFLRI